MSPKNLTKYPKTINPVPLHQILSLLQLTNLSNLGMYLGDWS